MPEEPQKKPHHHGDLRNALIQAGIAILSEDGLESLSLRRCAARAGVSHAAPAHHFGGLPGLRAAIIDEGFRLFRQAMLEARAKSAETPLAQLKSICRGYLQFALENPALFDLIFGAAPPLQDAEAAHDVSPAYLVLRDACAPFVQPGTDPRVIETQVWSLIHGFCHLYLKERFGPLDSANARHFPFEAVIGMLDHLPQPKTS